MKTICCLLFGLFFSFCNCCYGQVPVVEWQRSFGGAEGDYASSVVVTSDGGYVVLGFAGAGGGDVTGYLGPATAQNIWVIKLDALGKIEWQKCLSGFGEGEIRQTSDGGYIIGATTATNDCTIKAHPAFSLDYWVIKLNSQGDVLWQKTYGGSKHEYGISIDIAGDGGYVVAGYGQSDDGDAAVNYGNFDWWIVKIDKDGNLLWEQTVGGSNEDQAISVKATADGGCVVAGNTSSADFAITDNHGQTDGMVVKLDNTGKIEWRKCYGGTEREEFQEVQITSDGGYIVAGSTNSNDGDVSGNHQYFGNNSEEYWVVKLDKNGNIQWQRCYGGSKGERNYGMQTVASGGYVLYGESESSDADADCNRGVTDMLIIKIGSSGSIEWKKSLGGDNYERAMCVSPVKDGGFIVAGTTCSDNVSGYHTAAGSICGDYMIVKLSPPLTTPPAPTIAISPASGIFCVGTTTTLTAFAQYAGVSAIYQWTKNGQATGNNNYLYTANDFSDNDVITCTVTSGGECNTIPAQATATLTLKANRNIIQPAINISASRTLICEVCTPVTFQATVLNGGSAPIYEWRVNNSSVGERKQNFSITGLTPGDMVQCYLLDGKACVSNGPAVSNVVTMIAGALHSPTINIITSTTAVCSNTAVTFATVVNDAGLNPVYAWKINGIAAGTNNELFTTVGLKNNDVVTCSIKISPLSSCGGDTIAFSNSLAMVVQDFTTPVISINASSTTTCPGGTISFTATASGAGNNPTYTWKVNGIVTGENSSNFISSALLGGENVSCTLIVDTSFKCAAAQTVVSNNITISVNSQVKPTLVVAVDTNNVCAGTPLSFKATVQNAGVAPIYRWMVNNAEAGNNSSLFTIATPGLGDEVYCILDPGTGACDQSLVNSDKIIANIYPLPVLITFSPKDTVIRPGEKVQFSVMVNDPATTYQWTPANKLDDPHVLGPLTIPLFEDTQFNLRVTSAKGCTASATAIVKTGIPLIMPSAFSPDGNGLNDVFRIPPGVLLRLKEFTIFDRWGNKVFVTADISKGWDGNFHNKSLKPGIFIYTINGTDQNGAVAVKGTVMLLR